MALTDNIVARYKLTADLLESGAGVALATTGAAARFVNGDQPANLAGYLAIQPAALIPFTPTDGTLLNPALMPYPGGAFDPAANGWTRSLWVKNGGVAHPTGMLNTAPLDIGGFNNEVSDFLAAGFFGESLSGGLTGPSGSYAQGDVTNVVASTVSTAALGGWNLETCVYITSTDPRHLGGPGDEVHFYLNGVLIGTADVQDSASAHTVDNKIDSVLLTALNAGTGMKIISNISNLAPAWLDLSGLGWQGDENFWGVLQHIDWNRSISDAEITSLYNGGAGVDLGGAPPIIPPPATPDDDGVIFGETGKSVVFVASESIPRNKLYSVGQFVGVVQRRAEVGETAVMHVVGVFDLLKTTPTEVITSGTKVYFDGTSVVTSSGGNKSIGFVVKESTIADAQVKVRLKQ